MIPPPGGRRTPTASNAPLSNFPFGRGAPGRFAPTRRFRPPPKVLRGARRAPCSTRSGGRAAAKARKKTASSRARNDPAAARLFFYSGYAPRAKRRTLYRRLCSSATPKLPPCEPPPSAPRSLPTRRSPRPAPVARPKEGRRAAPAPEGENTRRHAAPKTARPAAPFLFRLRAARETAGARKFQAARIRSRTANRGRRRFWRPFRVFKRS